jgi:PhnB protein
MMTTSVKPVPDDTHTVVAYLCVHDAAEAIAFYTKAFGATETGARITDATGRVGHAQVRIGDSTVMLADEHPENGFRSPRTLGGCPMLFMLNVPDVDARVAQAVAAGGRLTRPVANQFYGDRTGEVTDPFGYRWYLSTHIEDVSEEEMLRRAAARDKNR